MSVSVLGIALYIFTLSQWGQCIVCQYIKYVGCGALPSYIGKRRPPALCRYIPKSLKMRPPPAHKVENGAGWRGGGVGESPTCS